MIVQIQTQKLFEQNRITKQIANTIASILYQNQYSPRCVAQVLEQQGWNVTIVTDIEECGFMQISKSKMRIKLPIQKYIQL